jgi:hypothetical protein
MSITKHKCFELDFRHLLSAKCHDTLAQILDYDQAFLETIPDSTRKVMNLAKRKVAMIHSGWHKYLITNKNLGNDSRLHA